jgi:hypothetical protein
MDYGFDFTNEICYISTFDGEKIIDQEPQPCPMDIKGRLAFIQEYRKDTKGETAVVVEEMTKEILAHSRPGILFLSKEEAFASYVLDQDEEIWKWDTAVFEFHKNYFSCMQLKQQGRMYFVSKTIVDEIPDIRAEKDKDKFFTKQTAGQLNVGSISNVFLVGEEFEGDWMELSLTSLCNGRRVFMGNHLFANGALTALKNTDENRYPVITEDFPLYYWGIRAFHHGQKDVFVPIIKPGEFWFDTEGSVEILIDRCENLEIEGLHSISKQKLTIQLPISLSRKIKDRTAKLKIKMRCISKNVLEITVYDMGFGASMDGTGMIYREEFKLP